MSHRTRRPGNRPATARLHQTGDHVVMVGGILASWLVYLVLAVLVSPVWAAYVAGSVLGVTLGLVLPRPRIAWRR